MIRVFLAAVVAAYFEPAIEVRRRLNRVGFSQRNPVSEKEILVLVESVVLAEDYPEILAFEAHAVCQVSPRPGEAFCVF